MTDRVNALTVVLERDVREDDVQPLTKAIGHLKGVASVGLNITDTSTFIAYQRARREWVDQLWDVL